MNRYDLALRAKALPGRLADRLSQHDYESINDPIQAGEWGEGFDILLATLIQTAAPLTTEERDELAALLTAIGYPTGQLDKLNVTI